MNSIEPKHSPPPFATRNLAWDKGEHQFTDGTPTTRQTKRALFLKGPIALKWLTAACALPGKALQAALCIRFVHGLTGKSTVTATSKQRVLFDLSRRAWYDALVRLEDARLIQVDRLPGRKGRITILEAADEGQIDKS